MSSITVDVHAPGGKKAGTAELPGESFPGRLPPPLCLGFSCFNCRMQPLHFSFLFVGFLLLSLVLRLWLASRQVRHVSRHRDAVPEPFAGQLLFLLE